MEKLSYYQKLSLAFYLAHKDKPVTLLSMFVFNVKLYVWILILSLGIILFNYFLLGPNAAGIVGALIVGVFLRDIGTFRKSIRNWPLLQKIIDWDKAASMMKQADLASETAERIA